MAYLFNHHYVSPRLQGADAIAHIIDAQQDTGDGLAQQSGLALDGVLAQGAPCAPMAPERKTFLAAEMCWVK